MQLFFKLIFREACVHRVRLALALLAIIATSCMSVWIIGSFDQLSAQKRDTAENYLGAYQLVLSPPAGMAGGPGGGMGKGMRGGRPGMGGRPGGMPGAMGEKPNAEAKPAEAKPGEGKPEMGGRPEGMGGMGGFGGGMGGGRPNLRALSPLTPQVIAMLRNDEDVVSVDTAMQCFGVQSALADENFSVYDRIRQGMGTPMGSALVVGINTTQSPFKLEEGRWFDTVVTGYPKDSQDVLECVVGSSAMKQMRPMGNKDKRKAEIGSIVQFYYNGVENKAKIVGVFEQGLSSSAPIQRGAPGAVKVDTTPKPVQITQGAIYVPLGAAAKLADCDPRTDLVYIKLKEGTDVKAFRQKYEKIFAEKESPLIFQDVNDVRTALTENQSASSILKQAYASIGLVLVAATFIIFTTLSMGVNERTRQLALLRCIGLSSGQIFFLIVGEAVLLGVLGGIGGVLAGYGLLWTSQFFNENNFSGNNTAVTLSGLCIGLTFLCSIGGALLASVIPGIRAARTKPIDALQESQFIPPHSWAWRSAVVGLILSSVTPIIVYGNVVSGALQKTLYGGLGLVLMSIGFLLLIPALIIISEKIFTPIASAIFGIPSAFLRGQLTRSLWRSVGTVISISVGLGLYCFFEIWGYSMLVPFTPTHDMPEALAAFFPKGISDADVEKVKACKAVDPDRFMVLQVEHAKFTTETLKKLDPKYDPDKPGDPRKYAFGMNDNMVIMGVDVAKAFEGSNPMLKFPLAEGTLKEAVTKLNSTEKNYCLVIDAFAQPLNLHVGDELEFIVPDPSSGRGTFGGLPKTIGTTSMTGVSNPGEVKDDSGKAKTVKFEIAGVLSYTGYQWMVKTSGLRFRQGRGGLIFCRDNLVWDAFNTPQEDRNRFFWFDEKKGSELDYNALNYAMTQIAEASGETLKDGNGASDSSAVTLPDQNSQIISSKGFAKVSTIESLNAFLNSRADSVIEAMAKMPLMILIISSIAVVNTMVASVRTRRWEIGLLRSISLTRFQTVRMIFAESLLLALVSCFVSFSLGAIAAWCSIGVSSTGAFGAVNVPLTFPWEKLGFGFALTLGLCLLAAVWTAFSAAREEPSKLLAGER